MMIVIIIATVKLEVEQNVSGCGGCIVIVSTSIRFRQILVKFLFGFSLPPVRFPLGLLFRKVWLASLPQCLDY